MRTSLLKRLWWVPLVVAVVATEFVGPPLGPWIRGGAWLSAAGLVLIDNTVRGRRPAYVNWVAFVALEFALVLMSVNAIALREEAMAVRLTCVAISAVCFGVSVLVRRTPNADE